MSNTSLVKPESLAKTSSYSGSGTYFSTNMKPTFAFKAQGIEFWGVAKYNLDDIDLGPSDLIVNCTGTLYTIKPFVSKIPNWLKLPAGMEQIPDQLLLEWKDMGAPPDNIRLDFWESIIEQSLERGVERIICCCGAGQGRTGTALAAFLLATGATSDPELAISYIRGTYSNKSIETKSQEHYLFELIYPEVGTHFGKVPAEQTSSLEDITEEEWQTWLEGSSWQNK